MTTVGPGTRLGTCVLVRGPPRDLARSFLDGARAGAGDDRMADAAPGLDILAGRDRELATLRQWQSEALAGWGGSSC